MSKLEELIQELCPDGVETFPLEECCNILDKKRKPVTKNSREKGEYPYYGANGVQDYVSDYIFNGKFVLVGEDGSVITKSGTPVVTWAEGKIWVNNHAHVIEEKSGTMLRYLYFYIQTILKSKYYDYALEKQIEISFGNVATTVFSEYRTRVENEFSKMSKENLLKLQAIEDKINSENPELYSQALTTCRRLFEGTAKELFEKYFPEYGEKKYKTKSGKEIDVSGEHYKNKLSAVIEKLEDKSPSKSMVGSNVIYLLDWIDNLTELQCKGVHHEVTRRDATRCIIQTYICLGDILSLQDE